MKYFLENVLNEKFSIWYQFFGGVVKEVVFNEMVFYYRDVIIVQEYFVIWSYFLEERVNICWIEELRNVLLRYIIGDYVNWLDWFIRDWLMVYYGENFKKF